MVPAGLFSTCQRGSCGPGLGKQVGGCSPEAAPVLPACGRASTTCSGGWIFMATLLRQLEQGHNKNLLISLEPVSAPLQACTTSAATW
jgi:hypothetical protein